jgi:hypothetical protein
MRQLRMVPVLIAVAVGLAACGGKSGADNAATENGVSVVDGAAGDNGLAIENEVLTSDNASDAGAVDGNAAGLDNAAGASNESGGNAL